MLLIVSTGLGYISNFKYFSLQMLEFLCKALYFKHFISMNCSLDDDVICIDKSYVLIEHNQLIYVTKRCLSRDQGLVNYPTWAIE